MRPETFGDLYGSLAASDAYWAGQNPFRPNPLDPYWRPHFYSTWWFFFGAIGLHRSAVGWVGAGLVLATLLALGLWLKPRDNREWLTSLALMVSPALLFAANRANNDLILFLLLSVALLLVSRSEQRWRLPGVALIAVAAVLKYYPAAALLVLCTAPTRRRLVAELSLALAVLLLGWPSILPALRSVEKYWQDLTGGFVFGSPTLWADIFSVGQWPRRIAWGALIVIGVWAWRRARRQPPRLWPIEFVAGSAVLCTCFALGNTYAYKLIYAAWIVPWCWRQGSESGWAKAVLGGLALAAWGDGLSFAINNLIYPRFDAKFGGLVHLVVQTGTWLMMAGLCAFLAEFIVSRGRVYSQTAVDYGSDGK